MSFINAHDRTITAKLVYYGPGLGGKTTSLKRVHRVLDPSGSTRLVNLRTDEERTLFFDFLPIEIEAFDGHRLRLQCFTVPGQVKYNLTRRYVLMGVDAVVFVADSQASRLEDNIESAASLVENLEANGINPEATPVVHQFNKRDLADAVPVADLARALNTAAPDAFESCATSGVGVYPAFVAACRLMVDGIAKRYGLKPHGEPLSQRIANHFEALSRRAGINA